MVFITKIYFILQFNSEALINVLLVFVTDEQYVWYCIEIQYQKLGLYWYWLIFPNSTIPITKQYQNKLELNSN